MVQQQLVREGTCAVDPLALDAHPTLFAQLQPLQARAKRLRVGIWRAEPRGWFFKT